MKTITLQGTENQLYNLQNVIEITDNEMPKEVETRVYVVDTHSLHSKAHWDISDSDFMMLAENQGTVYSLAGFQKDFNVGVFDEPHYVIRFINVTI